MNYLNVLNTLLVLPSIMILYNDFKVGNKLGTFLMTIAVFGNFLGFLDLLKEIK